MDKQKNGIDKIRDHVPIKIASSQNHQHQESGRHELLGAQKPFAPRNLVYEQSTAHGRRLEILFEHAQMPKAYVCDFHSARRLFGPVHIFCILQDRSVF